jgi:hypothetical protein
MNWRLLFRSIGSSGATPTSLSRWGSLTELLWHYVPTVCRIIHAEGFLAKTSLLVSSRQSDRPTLPLTQCVGSSGVGVSVLVRLYLDSNWASDSPTVSSLRSSGHPMLLCSLLQLCNSSGACRNWTVRSSSGAYWLEAPHSGSTTLTLAPTVPSISFFFLCLLLVSLLLWLWLHPCDLDMSTMTC